MRIYIVRHANPNYREDILLPSGKLEAEALARRLAKENIDYIYCSPMGRALETARYTAELIKVNPVIEDWLYEVPFRTELSPWGQISVCNISGEIIRENEPLPTHETWCSMDIYNNPELHLYIEGVKENSDKVFETHGYRREGGRYRCVDPNKMRIAVFCHNAIALTWLGHLLEIPMPLMWCGFWLAPSSITTILFEERSKEWAVPRCIGLGDTSHLYAAGLPIQSRSILENFD